MMKKTFRLIFSLCLLMVLCALFLTSCNHVHKYSDWTVTKEATCSTSGEQTKTCSCGKIKTRRTDLLPHTPGAAATCTEAQNCTVCKAEVAPPKGHDRDAIVVEATCTTDGYTSYTCTVCGDSRETNYVAAFGHTLSGAATCTTAQTCVTCNEVFVPAKGHDYSTRVVAPTCTERGYTVYTCYCGYTKNDNYVAALGHRIWEWVELPEAVQNYYLTNDTTYPFTTNDYGYIVSTNHDHSSSSTITLTALRDFFLDLAYETSSESSDVLEICLNSERIERGFFYEWEWATVELKAGDTLTISYVKDYSVSNYDDCAYIYLSTQSIATAEWQLVAATADKINAYPTCDGALYCDACDALLKDATDHTYESTVIAPTCTEDGYTHYLCACGDYYDDDYTEATGHTAGEAATCTEAQICTVCEAELVPARGHDNETVVTDPTCTEEGYTTHTCVRCGHEEIDTYVPSLGHTPPFDATCEEPFECTVCGESVESENGHIPGAEATCTSAQICIVCGEELAPILAHEYESVVTEPTCTENGYTTHTCTVCGHEEIDTVVDAFGHTPAADATCTALSECAVCGELLATANGHLPGAEATCTTAQTCLVCGEEIAPALDHDYEDFIVDPTCTEQGYTLHSCDRCGDEYEDEFTPALGHQILMNVPLPEGVVNFIATNDSNYPFAIQNGMLVSTNHRYSSSSSYTITAQRDFVLKVAYTVSSETNFDKLRIYHNSMEICTASGTHSDDLELELNAGDTVTFTYSKDGSGDRGDDCAYIMLWTGAVSEWQLVEATEELLAASHPCTEDICCDVCGEVLKEQMGHSYDETVVTEPTCISSGYTTYICVCGDSYDDDYTVFSDHTPAEGATCTDDTVCVVCGAALYTENGHVPGEDETCVTAQICLVCGEEVTPAYGHDYYIQVFEPDCTEAGCTSYYCYNCGDTYEDDFVEALGHTPNGEATCTEDSVCEVCDELLEEAFGHTPGEEATCTEAQTCTVCDEELAPALGHGIAVEVENYTQTNDTAYPFILEDGILVSTNHNSSSSSSYTITAERDFTLELKYKVSSESGCDYLRIYRNSISYVNVSGTTEWQTLTLDLVKGDTVTVTYSKDGSVSHGDDCAYVKLMTAEIGEEWIPATEENIERFPVCSEDIYCDVCGEEIFADMNGHMVWAEVELPEAVEIYTQTNDTTYPFILEDGILISTNHRDSSSSSYTITAMKDLVLDFEYKVSSEGGWDYLRIYHNTSRVINISGSYEWQSHSIDLVSGDTVTFTYYKDGSGSNGNDCAYINILTDVWTTTGIGLVEATPEILQNAMTDPSKDVCCACCGEVLIERLPSIGLEYIEVEDGTCFITGIGTCTDTEIVIPSMLADKPVSGIDDYAFIECNQIVSVVIPDSVTDIQDFAFYNCENLQSVTLGNGVVYIGADAFGSCEALTTVNFGSGLQGIGDSAFANADSLTEIVIPEGVLYLGIGAFEACYNLQTVTLPVSLATIEEDTFSECSALAEIRYNGTLEEWDGVELQYPWNYGVYEVIVVCTDGTATYYW